MPDQLRAHTKVLNALRQTQLDNHREFTDFRAETRANFADVRSVLATVAVGQMHLTRLIEGMTK